MIEKTKIKKIFTRFIQVEELVTKYEFSEKKLEIHIDLIEEEIKVNFKIQPEEGNFYCYSESSDEGEVKDKTISGANRSVYEVVQKLLEKYLSKRDSILHEDDEIVESPLLLSDEEDEKDAKPFLTQEEIDDLVDEEELPSPTTTQDSQLIANSEELNMLFPNCSNVIKGISVLKLNLPLQQISQKVKKIFNSKEKEAIFTVQFNADYTKSTIRPSIKPTIPDNQSGSMENRILVVMENFFRVYWADLKTLKHPKNLDLYPNLENYKKELKHSISTHSFGEDHRKDMDVSFFSNEEKLLFRLLKNKQTDLVKAIILMENNLDLVESCDQILKLSEKVERKYNKQIKKEKDKIAFLSESEIDNLESLILSTSDSNNEQDDKKENLLLKLVVYSILRTRMDELLKFCVSCDRKLEMLDDLEQDFKTTHNQGIFSSKKDEDEKEEEIRKYLDSTWLCTNFKCCYSVLFQKLFSDVGTMKLSPVNVCQDILENSQIVDLYLVLFHAALTSGRRDTIFDPYPPGYMLGKQSRNYEELIKVFETIPSVSEMKQYCIKGEKNLILKLGEKAYALLRWILTYKRNYLVKIPFQKTLLNLRTDNQYFLIFKDVKKMKKFKQLKAEYGSKFAFHGSGLENWHNILKNNLRNATGSSYQTTGAAYGAGIYLAPQLATSMGYSRVGQAWKKSMFNKGKGNNQLRCVAICEIINKGIGNPNPYWVIKDESLVVTRFFLFYKESKNVNVNIKYLEKQLKEMLKF